MADIKQPVTTSIAGLFDELAQLPVDEQKKQITEIINFLEIYRENIGRPVPQLPEPDGDYPRFTKGVSGHPYDWLKEHWGTWLKHFNKELDRDYLFLDQLGKLDLQLKKELYSKKMSISRRTGGLDISDIIPTRSVRINMELQDADPEKLRKAERLLNVCSTRQHRSYE